MAYLMNGSVTFGARFRAAALGLMATLSLSACATDQGGARVGSASGAMRDGGIVMPPAGWLNFCGQNANDPSCKVVRLDQTRWKELQAVQASLRAVRQVAEKKGQADVWQVANGQGDCEDIALLARARLLAAGWPLSAVRLATAWTENGDYHTILTVDAVKNGTPITYVLDNRFAVVLSYGKLEEIGYRFHMRQAARGPNWVAVRS
ncbi:transglutaminase-like cysteine peptidase [Sphingomonas montanisoli]|uniref:Transglutaminase-like cysteine peptidase n=1 Tax=Sphingomonas montanisoli TaxID=2606412 RepID=A0A5D9C943_9SPHN|nr:transglutaminase-like cysteine peptidase [Sphingomonas montanisoli]TZG27570.1 transglutaminase-like cysteine peptidase [Sphingomonas montanisoli]